MCSKIDSLLQKDFLTAVAIEGSEGGIKKTTVTWTSRLNILGYFPVVSLITGIGRALLGIIHTIRHLVLAIFADDQLEAILDGTSKSYHLYQASIGAKNIGRGLVEALPLIGNLSMLIFDKVRISGREKLLNQFVDVDHQTQQGKYTQGKAYFFHPAITSIEDDKNPILSVDINDFKELESRSFIP